MIYIIEFNTTIIYMIVYKINTHIIYCCMTDMIRQIYSKISHAIDTHTLYFSITENPTNNHLCFLRT